MPSKAEGNTFLLRMSSKFPRISDHETKLDQMWCDSHQLDIPFVGGPMYNSPISIERI